MVFLKIEIHIVFLFIPTMARPYRLIDTNSTYTSYTIRGIKYVLEETYNHQVKLIGNNIKVLQNIVNCFDDYVVNEPDLWISKRYRVKRFMLEEDYDKLRTQYDKIETQNEEFEKQNSEFYNQNVELKKQNSELYKQIESDEDYEELKKQNEELRKFKYSSIIHLFNKEFKKQNEEFKKQNEELKTKNEELHKIKSSYHQRIILILISIHIIYYLFI